MVDDKKQTIEVEEGKEEEEEEEEEKEEEGEEGEEGKRRGGRRWGHSHLAAKLFG
jgi:hypothetical protein